MRQFVKSEAWTVHHNLRSTRQPDRKFKPAQLLAKEHEYKSENQQPYNRYGRIIDFHIVTLMIACNHHTIVTQVQLKSYSLSRIHPSTEPLHKLG